MTNFNIGNLFKNKTILITGGTGSFGSTAVKKILKIPGVEQIRILSRDENKQYNFRKEVNSSKLRCYIGDVRDYNSVKQAAMGVNYIFHAAALKQVPSCEFHPNQALKTNCLGTENVINATQDVGAERAVFLSTDKAVNPVNVMGMSKALMEKLVIAKARFYKSGSPIFCCTRYGNVMCSRGSVIPLFINQIKQGKPITITAPEMTRFMMSLEDSVDLVFYALQNGKVGDIFVQKAPAATIETLVQALQEIFNSRCEIEIIGVRHGEKMHESLLSKEEMNRSEDLGKYYRLPLDERDLNYKPYFDYGNRTRSDFEEYTSFNTERLDVKGMKKILLSLPEVQKILND